MSWKRTAYLKLINALPWMEGVVVLRVYALHVRSMINPIIDWYIVLFKTYKENGDDREIRFIA